MADYVTDLGFIKRRQDQIKAGFEASFKEIYGASVQLADETTNGQKIGAWSEIIADAWDLAQAVFNSFNPNGVTGATQDLLYFLNNLKRQLPKPSTAELTFYGIDTTIIPAGFEVSTAAGFTFSTDISAEIGTGDPAVPGEVKVAASALITGALQAASGTIIVINQPLIGVVSVTNLTDAVLGRSLETNIEFRSRRFNSTSIAALNLLESAFSQLANLDDVTDLRIYQNKTNILDPITGIPGHNWMSIVEGGTDEAVGQIVWKNLPAGIDSFGDVTVNVQSEAFPEILNPVHFQRPALKEVYVSVTVKKDALYPGDGAAQIRQNIVDYAAGLLIEDTGFSGFKIGQDVTYSRIYQPINLVQGHSITELFIDFIPSPIQAGDLTIAFNEKSTWAIERINVTEVL